jgi:cobalt-zinc-cadmium efflux system outer membrane protein
MHQSPVDLRMLVLFTALSGIAKPIYAQGSGRSDGTVRISATAPALTLEQVLRATLTGHPLLDAAQARVRAAVGIRRTAGALGNPMLTYQVENARLPGGGPLDMPRETMTSATFPLEAFYQRGSRARGADAEVRAAEAEAATDRQHLALDAAHAYYRLALAQEQVAAAHDLAAWLDTVVAYNRARVLEGAAAEADLLRSQLERDHARAELTMVEVDYARAQADLAAFALDSTGVVATVAVEAPSAPLRVPTASALPERPEMRAARERVSAASAGITTEHRLFVRELGVMVGAKQSSGMTSLLLGASMPLPLFNQNRGDIDHARAGRDIRTAELATVARTIRAEVAGAEAAARLLTARADELMHGTASDTGSYLVRADEARRIALGAYQEGAVSLLQVLDAARTWGDARLTFYRTLYAQHESVLAVLIARGADLLTSLPATVARPGDQSR